MTLRAGDGFRFPNQKYDDSKALYVNFRYMQEYLNRIWDNSKGAPDVIIAPSDGVDPSRADIQCNGENDEVQLTQAMARLPADGGWIHLQAGNFYFGSTFSQTLQHVRITGAGSADSENRNPVTTIHGVPGISVYDCNDQDGVILENLHIDGDGATHGVYAALADDSNIVLNNVSITACTVGINANRSSSRVFLRGCTIISNTGTGFQCYESAGFVTNSTFHNNGGWGIHTEYGASLFVSNSWFANNTTGGLGFGGPTQGSKSVVNCLITGGGYGILSSSILYGPTIAIGNVVNSNSNADMNLGSNSIAVGNYTDDAPSATVSMGNLVGGVPQLGDHGGLTGLGDDDHTQYVLRSILSDDGDLFVRAAGAVVNIPVGTDGQVLTADSGESAKLKWADPTGGSGSGTSSNQEFRKIFLLGGM